MSDATYYKVSYVVEDGSHTGAIVDSERAPQVGDEVYFDGAAFVITEIQELIPASDDFGFLHATCRFVREL
jgi:hypothetical protein